LRNNLNKAELLQVTGPKFKNVKPTVDIKTIQHSPTALHLKSEAQYSGNDETKTNLVAVLRY
jgi:hypothetical protein